MEVQQSLSYNRKLQRRRVPPASSVVAAVCSASEFTFGLLLDFRKHRTILSFINNAVSFVSAPISPLSLPQPGTHETSNWPISCELWLILTNQQPVLRRLWAPLILAAIFWCMREGFYHLPVRDERNAVECKNNWIENMCLCGNSERNKLTFSEYFCSKL